MQKIRLRCESDERDWGVASFWVLYAVMIVAILWYAMVKLEPLMDKVQGWIG